MFSSQTVLGTIIVSRTSGNQTVNGTAHIRNEVRNLAHRFFVFDLNINNISTVNDITSNYAHSSQITLYLVFVNRVFV
jgi:hypothetical protein